MFIHKSKCRGLMLSFKHIYTPIFAISVETNYLQIIFKIIPVDKIPKLVHLVNCNYTYTILTHYYKAASKNANFPQNIGRISGALHLGEDGNPELLYTGGDSCPSGGEYSTRITFVCRRDSPVSL